MWLTIDGEDQQQFYSLQKERWSNTMVLSFKQSFFNHDAQSLKEIPFLKIAYQWKQSFCNINFFAVYYPAVSIRHPFHVLFTFYQSSNKTDKETWTKQIKRDAFWKATH